MYTLPAYSRTTIPVNTQLAELASTDVSASISSTEPILVERAMYRSIPGQPFAAGHDSAGVTAPATSWFLAEGATGPFFDLFVLLANPTPTAGRRRGPLSADHRRGADQLLPAATESRRTIYVDGETFRALVRRSSDATVSCVITSTNAVPIVVERSMWFPGPR